MPGPSSFPAGFANGLTIRNLPVHIPHPGQTFWVNNSSVLAPGGVGGSNGNPGTYTKPFASIDYAIGRCTAGRGDVIYVMPNHVETLTAAGGIAFDVAGVTVIGLGSGSTQAQVRFEAAAASITVTAANVTWTNLRLTAAFADVTAAITLSAAADNFTSIGCLYDEETTNENYVVVFSITGGADGAQFIGNKYYAGDAANDHFAEFLGTHNKVVFQNNFFMHNVAQTAVVPILESATAMTNCLLLDNYFVTTEPVLAASCVVFSGTTNTGFAMGNVVAAKDADASAANAVSAFDITGMLSGPNYVADTVDQNGVVFAPGDLT
jgi:hypothetical protein